MGTWRKRQFVELTPVPGGGAIYSLARSVRVKPELLVTVLFALAIACATTTAVSASRFVRQGGPSERRRVSGLVGGAFDSSLRIRRNLDAAIPWIKPRTCPIQSCRRI